MRLISSPLMFIMIAVLQIQPSRHAYAQVFDQVYPDFPANEMTDLLRWNGDTLFACGFNWTLQRSTDAGATWEEMLDGYPKYNLVRMGSDGNSLYLLPVATGFTQDDMKNDPRILLLRYDPRTDRMESVYIDRIPVHNPLFPQVELSVGSSAVTFLKTYRDSVWLVQSSDSGSSWRDVSIPQEYYDNENSSINQLRIRDSRNAMISITVDSVPGEGSRVYVTNDGGESWSEVGSVRQQFVGYARTPPEPGGFFGDSIVVAVHERTTPVISTDRGRTWKWCAPVSGFIEALSFDESGSGYVVDESSRVWKTLDFGESWVKCREGMETHPSGQNLGCIAQFGPDTVVTMDFYGQVMRTVDGGISWDAIRTGELWEFLKLQFVTPELGWVVAEDRFEGGRRYLRTTDGGVTWSDFGDFPVTGQNPYFFHLDQRHAYGVRNHLYSQTSDSLIFRSTDGGSHWEPVYFWSEADSIDLNILVRGHWFCSRDTGYAPLKGNRLLRTTDGGDTWDLLPGPIVVVGSENDMRLEWMDARGSPMVWIAATREILRTEDAGATWTSVLSLPDSVTDSHGFSKVEVLSDGGIFVLSDKRIYHSSDDGLTWENWEATAPWNARTVQFTKLEGIEAGANQNLYWYGSQSNINTTTDGWKTRHLEWSFGFEIVRSYTYTFFLDRQHMWIYGMNAIYRSTDGGINWTNVTPSIPQSPRILSTWPQPAPRGGMMSTEVELPGPGPVRMELYDLLGRRRAVLWDAEVTATRRTVPWSTAGLERGVYVLRMVTAAGSASGRVVVH
ncbi:MAG: hypothetical protein JXA28_14810 [Bacteroidetes bacterium]|nr:hypothetical protein [Bacteroidota bacterium]